MLCSIPTAKSGSNWLDRLRSIKGFPAADNLDLDHFLSNPNPPASPLINASDSPDSNAESTHSNDKQLQNPNPPPPPPEVTSAEPSGDKKWFGIMTNVLSELFNMGEQAPTSRFSKKKSSRKQTNPRICIFNTPDVNSTEERKSSSDNVRKDKDVLVSTRSLSSREEAKRESEQRSQNNNVEGEEEEGEDKGEAERELVGYSRSEATVIDTSCKEWKADKLIFKRKNIWKVKDKKGKSRAIGRKKRKPPPPSQDNCVCNKKPKISSLELIETSRTQCGSPINRGRNAPDDKREEVHNEAADGLTQVLRNRFPYSRLPRKSGKGGSSVILMKAIPTGKKNGGKLAMNLKDSQRKYKTL
ncbi:uncharacterized protein LOC120158554 isoform X2 [Hibiscus syriacus]|uniref:uncharacterized protein LOC120158554 isoform X2 n=1 Tax=Hibiscus syriacus TaxID=106335 RepID=UPI00192381E8|nr:uncharacterized protein LOC120158554 isoform X2 [Hibiscus syriacus]